MTDNERHRTVVLRDEQTGPDRRHLSAYLGGDGNLHIHGHDLGPGTSPVSDDGEYEWFTVYAAAHVPAIVALLDGEPGEDVLAGLASRWTGDRAGELERRLQESGLPVKRSVWS